MERCKFEEESKCYALRCGSGLMCGCKDGEGKVVRSASMTEIILRGQGVLSCENVASEEISRDPDDALNVYPGERVIGSFDFDNREDGK